MEEFLAALSTIVEVAVEAFKAILDALSMVL